MEFQREVWGRCSDVVCPRGHWGPLASCAKVSMGPVQQYSSVITSKNNIRKKKALKIVCVEEHTVLTGSGAASQ